MFLWVEACNTTIYLQNKILHRLLEGKTLEEAFTGVKPEIKHLKIFDYLVYIHVPEEKRMKFEPSREKGMFVGYNETSKAYKIFMPV